MALSKKEKEIRRLLRAREDIHCLDQHSYIATLYVALRMPFGQVNAKIIKPNQIILNH